MTDRAIADAIALLKADLVWDKDFEQMREALLVVLLASELETAKLAIAQRLLGDANA